MIDLAQDFDAMAASLQPLLAGWADLVVPREVTLVSNPRYSPRYAWMFSYERKLRDRLCEILGRKSSAVFERVLFGADGVVSEGLSNAFVHGHGRDPLRPIRVRCVVSENGLAVSITDQGPGFDVPSTVRMVEEEGRYFRQAGNGMRAFFDREGVTVSYDDGGRTLNIRYNLADGG